VVTDPERRTPRGELAALVICDCGTQKIVGLQSLFGGDSVSCGCLRRERWAEYSRSPEHLARLAEMNRTPESLARLAAARQSPEHREHVAEWNRSPENLAHLAELTRSPEHRARFLQMRAEFWSVPRVGQRHEPVNPDDAPDPDWCPLHSTSFYDHDHHQRRQRCYRDWHEGA
jgi:hypothetical protein